MKTTLRSILTRNQPWLTPLAFLVIGALVYLPLAAHFGFYRDDWYLMYDARVQGPGFFSTIFASDRPARAPLQYLLYTLFGEHLLYYHISAWIYRVTGAVLLWVTLGMVWPAQKRANLLMAALFLIYPGFLSQPNAVDFQAHLFSLMLAMLSLALSVKAVLATPPWVKWTLTALAILTGWVYLALMEYFIGLEALRLGLIALLVFRQANGIKTFTRRLFSVYGAFFLAPAGFLFWRLLIFQSERRATDIGAQVGQLFASPLNTGLGWLLTLAQDTVSVLVNAWIVPFYNLVYPMRLRDLIPALGLGLLVAVILWVVWQALDETESGWQREAFLVGLAAVVGGLFPVILANRHVDFSDYSRYTLPALAGAMLVLVALVSLIQSQPVRSVVILFLAMSATMTHYANAVNAVAEANATRNFWWQVAWRVPGLKAGTTLVADYPAISIQEDYFIWGPANQIYFPEKQSGDQVEVPLTAFVLTSQNTLQISVGRGEMSRLRRGNATLADYHNVLVLTQPASNACVRIIDGKQPELSENDRPEIMLVAPASRLANVEVDTVPHPPPSAIFSAEPPHGWCYYYQKAALARQLTDWKSVAALGEKALTEGYYPADKIEWLPFMQAYALLGQKEKLRRFVSIMGESPFIQKQACAILTTSTTDPEILTYIKESFCK